MYKGVPSTYLTVNANFKWLMSKFGTMMSASSAQVLRYANLSVARLR